MSALKNKYNIYVSIIAVLLLFTNTLFGQVSQYGDFPYEQSLLNGPGSVPDMIRPTSPDASRPNRAEFIQGLGLKLTRETDEQSFGAVFVDKRQFSSVVGIHIEFEYMMYDGTGGDGLSMFLFDASISAEDLRIGAPGAGIGYAYNRAPFINSSKRYQGLTGGYLGVALDQFGNFKGLRYQGESRVNGIPYTGGNTGAVYGSKDVKYNTQSQVTLRGAKGRPLSPAGLTDGFTGYPVLITQSTNDKFTDAEGGTDYRPGFVIDANSSDYRYKLITDYNGDLFPISGGDTFLDSSDPNYRKAIIELFPAPKVGNNSDGFLITVSIQHGQTTDVIISDFHYKERFNYQENALPLDNMLAGDNDASDNIRNSPATTYLDAAIPAFLRIGFAASTGDETNIHVIKNLKISLPRAAEADDDEAETNQGIAVSLMPLENDIAYNGQIQKVQEGKPEYLDVNTFRFRDYTTGNVITGNTHTDEHGNLWTFTYENAPSPMDRTVKVSLTPHPSFHGEAKIKYDILGGRYQSDPYGDPAYRSLPATITVDVKEAPVTYRNIISNKMVTIKLK